MQADAPPSCPKCRSTSVDLLTTSSIKTAAKGGTEHKLTTLNPPIWICGNCHHKWPKEEST